MIIFAGQQYWPEGQNGCHEKLRLPACPVLLDLDKIALERERLEAERRERERRFELESQERQVILDLLKEKVLKGWHGRPRTFPGPNLTIAAWSVTRNKMVDRLTKKEGNTEPRSEEVVPLVLQKLKQWTWDWRTAAGLGYNKLRRHPVVSIWHYSTHSLPLPDLPVNYSGPWGSERRPPTVSFLKIHPVCIIITEFCRRWWHFVANV